MNAFGFEMQNLNNAIYNHFHPLFLSFPAELPLYNFNCGFGWGSHKTLCQWEHDNQVDLKWAILTSKTGPIQDHTGNLEFMI